MAPLLRTALLLYTVLLPFASAALKLGEVFDVYMEDAPGNCREFYNPKDANSLLETWWSQAKALNENARKAIKSYEGKDNEPTRFMAKSMFGIQWDEGGKEPPEHTGDSQRLDIVRQRFSSMREFMKYPPKKDKRPKLFCDSTYRRLQTPESPFMNIITGKPVPKDPSKPDGPFQTLGEQADKAEFEQYWYFYYDVPGSDGGRERAYTRMPKLPSQKNTLAPYKIDPDTKEPSICADDLTGTGRVSENFVAGGHQKTAQVVICAKYLMEIRDDLPNDLPSLLEKSPKTHEERTIREMRLRATSLYHELWHIVFPLYSPDVPWLMINAKDPKAQGYGNPHGEAPHFYKWPQDCRSWAYIPNVGNSDSFKMCNAVALFDQCTGGRPLQRFHPRVGDVMQPHAMAVLAPENYVWFSIGVWLNAKTKFQWNAGVRDEKGAEYRGMVDVERPEYPLEWILEKYGRPQPAAT